MISKIIPWKFDEKHTTNVLTSVHVQIYENLQNLAKTGRDNVSARFLLGRGVIVCKLKRTTRGLRRSVELQRNSSKPKAASSATELGFQSRFKSRQRVFYRQRETDSTRGNSTTRLPSAIFPSTSRQITRGFGVAGYFCPLLSTNG